MQGIVWAEARDITSLDDCQFYHTMDLPNLGTVEGAWDLRGRESTYLGDVDVQGHSVLEVGTASGQLCFAMEKMGANVTAYDLSDEQEWDIVPYDGHDFAEHIAERKAHMRLINNGWWAAHKDLGSNARVAYGTVYEIPDDIGQFDIGTFGSILLHLRDPFLALQRVAAHVTETMIVTDLAQADSTFAGKKVMDFVPNGTELAPTETWWRLTPEVVEEFLHVLGFMDTTITLHHANYEGRDLPLFTVVGRRMGVGVSKPARSVDASVSAASQERTDAIRRDQEEATLSNISLKRVAGHAVRRAFGKLLPK